jgi:hypothetical protein
MAVSPSYLAFVLEQLDGIRDLVPKRMFGGVGLYSGETFFAVIDNDTLFFKVDEALGAHAAVRADSRQAAHADVLPGATVGTRGRRRDRPLGARVYSGGERTGVEDAQAPAVSGRLTRCPGAREQQVGQVRARKQQHEPRQARQDEHRRAERLPVSPDS